MIKALIPSNNVERRNRSSYPDRYTTRSNGLEAVREAAIERMGKALSVLEGAIEPGPYLLGDAMSLVDVYVAMLFTWYRGDNVFPKLTTLKAAVKQIPIVMPIWQRHFGDR